MEKDNYVMLNELACFWAAYLSLNSQEKTLKWRFVFRKFIKASPRIQ